MNILQSRATISCIREQDLIVGLYKELVILQDEYPAFEKWFFEKVVPGSLTGKRNVFVAYCDDQLAGILVLKDTDEKKICTLRVSANFRKMGIGHQLMDCAISVLKTSHPVITVSDDHVQEFYNLLTKDYGFKLTEVHYGYYRENHAEYVFNGALE
jgi:ribosomal protein S18 acetylase RimI-like enzyme